MPTMFYWEQIIKQAAPCRKVFPNGERVYLFCSVEHFCLNLCLGFCVVQGVEGGGHAKKVRVPSLNFI